MYRVYRNGKHWRNRWPFNRLWPQRVDERFCRTCSLPYHHGPMPKEIAQFQSGSIAAVLLPRSSWQERFTVRIGKWKPSSGRYYLSEFIPSNELGDLERVIVQVRKYLNADASGRQRR